MTILWEPDRDRAAAEFASLDGADEVRAVDNVNDVAAWLDHSEDERIVVIGAAVPFVDVTAFAGHLHATYPDAVIVLVRTADEHDVVAEALAAGIVEVVGSDDLDELRDAHDRAVQLRELSEPESDAATDVDIPRSEDGDITVVFSAKGGSGKTVVSTNLALALVATGSRVCLVDLDLEFGDVAVCLQLAPSRNIADGANLDLSR